MNYDYREEIHVISYNKSDERRRVGPSNDSAL